MVGGIDHPPGTRCIHEIMHILTIEYVLTYNP